MQVVARQVVDGHPRDAPLLPAGHRRGARPAEVVASPAPSPRRTRSSTRPRDDVDFAEPRAVAAFKNCVPASHQFGAREIFARISRGTAASLVMPDADLQSPRRVTAEDHAVARPEAGAARARALRPARRRAPRRGFERMSACCFVSTSGGDRRMALRPAPRTSSPRVKHSCTSASRSVVARSFVCRSRTSSMPIIRPAAAHVADDRMLVHQRLRARPSSARRRPRRSSPGRRAAA